MENGDATVVVRDGSPRVGDGLRVLIEDQDIREELRGVNWTINVMHAQERAQDITRT